MPTQIRHKRSGALIFHQTKDENQQVKDRRKIEYLENQIKVLVQIINKIGGKNENKV